MNTKDLVNEVTSLPFVTKILDDIICTVAVGTVETRRISYLETVDNFANIKTIEYLHDTKTDECWYRNTNSDVDMRTDIKAAITELGA